MITITLKDIPKTVHSALKNRAKQHGRSLNKEALACLEAAVAPARINVQSLLEELREHRASLPGHLKDDLLNEAKMTGRP
jgi:plasmid stability protein